VNGNLSTVFLPKCSAVPSIGSELVNKTYVDSSVGAVSTLTNVAQPTNNAVSYNTGTAKLTYTTGTSISLFADATARDAALTAPFLGQFCFLTGSSRLQYYNTVWNTYIGPQLNSISVTNFTLNSTYTVSYVNRFNSPIPAPNVDGFTIYRFFPTTTTFGSYTPLYSSDARALVAGGGGGGAGSFWSSSFSSGNGGGGGAGGLISGNDGQLIGLAGTVVGGTTYSITVGGGGAGGSGSNGSNGENSVLNWASGTLTAIGGGGGGTTNGLNGGSGGGAGADGNFNRGGLGTVATQGYNGGAADSTSFPAGRGGGADGDGLFFGGAGRASSITGASVTYCGGGGGGTNTDVGGQNQGGVGGGGQGGFISGGIYTPPLFGTNGLAGGGGGAGGQSQLSSPTVRSAGNGGSGVVILRIPSYV
jgi:hypothetical protein